MTVARFPVQERFDMASSWQRGTVTVDRAARLFSVRVLRKRRVYTLPLDAVAQLVVRTIIVAEVREKRNEKAAKRKARRRSS